MKTQRLLAFLAACLIHLAANAGNTGVVFVHGTGKQTDAATNYWTWDMINSVRQGLPNPALYLVVNCDFDQYMWAAAASGCLADQLYPFIVNNNITDLVVETHSNGGNVVRWIMSNPTLDSRYPKIISAIRWVNALAPSSLGTPLADAAISGNVFETAVGWLLGYNSDAVRQQQTSWMANYNATVLYGTPGRPSLPKPFYNVVGTNVDANIFDSAAYCGGYTLHLGLDITQAWLDSCCVFDEPPWVTSRATESPLLLNVPKCRTALSPSARLTPPCLKLVWLSSSVRSNARS